jgi:hypothetical protein
MAFQPGRILEADNAALLLNTFAWLLDESVTNAMRKNFKKKCCLLDPSVNSGVNQEDAVRKYFNR